MGYTPRETVISTNSLNTYDSGAPGTGAFSASATLGCNSELIASLTAIKGAGAFIQGAGSGSVSGGQTTIAQAFAVSNVSGNCIVVDVVFDPTSVVPTGLACADTQGNTYALVFSHKVSGGLCQAAQFIAFGIHAGANTVTVTAVSDEMNEPCIAIHEYANGSSVDANTFGQIVSSGTISISVTTTQSNDRLHYAIGVVVNCPGSPHSITGGNPLVPPSPPDAWLIVNEPTLGFTDRSSFLYLGEGANHSFNLQTRQRGQATYTLISDPQDPESAPTDYLPVIGSPIYLFDQNAAGYTLVFAGLIQDFTFRQISIFGAHYIDVTAVSLESVFDTVYAKPVQYVNETCGFIVADLFARFEAGCPVNLDPTQIQDGATIPLFNAQLGDKPSDLFGQLATTSQFVWNVNPQTQTLFFGVPTTTTAPFELTSTTALWDSISVKTDAADYRNRQAVKLSYDAFPHSCEFFVGSGQTTITLARPVQQVTNAWATLSTCGASTGSFSGQPSPGDTVTIGIPTGAGFTWQAGIIYAVGGQIVQPDGFVQKITFASGLTTTGVAPSFTTITNGTTTDSAGNIWTCQGPLGLSTGEQTYTFVTAIDNTQFGQVLIGATTGATAQNLVDALNATVDRSGIVLRGVTFSLPTWENAQINAISLSGTSFVAQQKHAGSGPISSLAATGTAFSWSSATTVGGTSPNGSLGPGEGATISLQVYAEGTSTAAPGLAYQEGSAVVTLATPLNSGSNLNVEYTRTDGNVIEVEDTSLVTALAIVTHGTGKYQQIVDASSTGLVSTSAAAGLQFAQEALAAFSPVPTELDVVLYQPGLVPGQQFVVNLTGAMSVYNATYFLQEVSAQLIPTYPYLDNPNAIGAGHYQYTVRLIDIAQIGDYMDFWEGLGGGGAGGGGSSALVATSGGGSSSTALTFPQDFSRRTNSGQSFISGSASGFDDIQYKLADFQFSTSDHCVFTGNFDGAIFHDSDFTDSTFTGSFIGCDFSGATIDGCTFSGDFTGCNFTSASLSGGGFTASGCNFTSANFTDAGPFTSADFHGSIFAASSMIDIDFTSANFQAVNMIGISFRDCTLTSADFTGNTSPGQKAITSLSACTFYNTDLSSTKFIDAQMLGCWIFSDAVSPAQLNGADFTNANLNGTTIENADVDGAVFASAIAQNCRFNNLLTTSTPVSFAGADLSGSTFTNCTFTGSFAAAVLAGTHINDLLTGSLNGPVRQVSASYTLVADDVNRLISVGNASPHTSVTLTLPGTPVSETWAVSLQNTSSFSVTLDPGIASIDGVASTLPIPAGGGLQLYSDGTNYFTERGLGGGGGGSGTVTSVALTMPAEFVVAGSPITGSGTFAVTKANETANTVYAGPSTGSAAAPAFRALVAADVPGSLTNPMTTKGDVIVGATSGTPARLGVGSNGQVLTANSAATDGVDWEAVPTATSSVLGLVKPDGTIITVTAGAITVPKASATAFGVVEVDNVTITASAGVISAVGGGSGAMTRIAQTVLGSPAASVTFSSIPGTFTSLMLMINGSSSTGAANDNVIMQFNADTAAHYAYSVVFSVNGGAPSAFGGAASATPFVGGITGATASFLGGALVINIPVYSGAVFSKFATFQNSTNTQTTGFSAIIETGSMFWSGTAAINAIELFLSSGANFIAGSVFTLYGLS